MGDNCSLCLLQHKYNHNYQTETEIFFLPGADAPDIYVRASTLCYQRNLSQTLEVGVGGGVTDSANSVRQKGACCKQMHVDK